MCEPTTMIMAAQLAVAGASAASGVKAAKRQYQREEEAHEENKQAAHDAFILETHLMSKRVQEQRMATSQKDQDNSIKRMKASASAEVAAASASTQGASVQQVLHDFKRSEGVVSDRLAMSGEAFEDQTYYQGLSAGARAEDRARSIPMPTMDGIYSAQLRGVSKVVGAFSDFRDYYTGEVADV